MRENSKNSLKIRLANGTKFIKFDKKVEKEFLLKI